MKFFVLLLLAAALAMASAAAATTANEKGFRDDYFYNKNNDRFYKLHLAYNSDLFKPDITCNEEGTRLMTDPTPEDIAMLGYILYLGHTMGNYFYVGKHDEPGVPSDQQKCKLITRTGQYLSSVQCKESSAPFMCMIDAKDIGPRHSVCGTFSHNYEYVPSVGSCYLVSNLTYPWIDARGYCSAEGAHLPIINSREEHDVLKNLIKHAIPQEGHHEFFVGFKRARHGDGFRLETTNGKPLETTGYSDWAEGEPNEDTKKRCGVLRDTDGKMKLVESAFPIGDAYRFICEKEVTK